MATRTDTTLESAYGTTPEEARDARARAWAFVFRCYESKKNPAASQSVRGNSDGTANKEHFACEYSTPR